MSPADLCLVDGLGLIGRLRLSVWRLVCRQRLICWRHLVCWRRLVGAVGRSCALLGFFDHKRGRLDAIGFGVIG
jgi:hypothetical protein